jgi:TPR repeat protein
LNEEEQLYRLDGATFTRIGIRYYERGGTRTNFERASQWFELAIELEAREHSDGQAFYYFALLRQEGLVPNDRRTYSILNDFLEAAERGITEACFWLGYLHERGIGAPRDIDQARVWYRRGADAAQPDPRCQQALRVLERML